MDYPVGENEEERLALLEALGILNGPPDPAYERICRLAQDIFGVSSTSVSLLGRDRQVFKACAGMGLDGTPRSQAFCNYTILSDAVFVVEDARADPRFKDNPLVTGVPGIRFYAGAPLTLEPGMRLGSLCLVSGEPRTLTAEERERLKDLAAVVVEQIELHRSRTLTRQHRNALAASEERLRLAVETTGLGIWEYSEADGSLALSTEGRAILGLPSEGRLEPRDLLPQIHGGDRRRFLASLRRWRSDAPQSIGVDVRLTRLRDRAERWIAVKGHRVDRAGAQAIVGSVQDVTDLQVRAQQQQGLALLGQIALQEGDLSALLAASCDILARTLSVDLTCIALADGPGRRLRVASGGGRLFERLRPRLEELSESYLLHRAFVASEPVLIVDAAFEDAAWRETVGERLGLQSSMAVGIGDVNRRLGAIGVTCTRSRRFAAADMSFLEAAAFMLAAALDRREAIATLRLRDRALDAVAQGIAVCDARHPALPLVYVNPAVERLTGLTLDELNEKGASILLGGEDVQVCRERLRGQLERGGQSAGRVTCSHRDGRTFQDEFSVSAVRDDTGLTTHYVAVHTDVTDRMRLEAEVRQSQKMDAIGKLTGGVAHDFNNLLTVILGNSEIVAEMAEDPQLRALAEMVVQAAERGADTVQRLLAFGRRQDLEPEKVDVNEVLLSVVGLLRTSVGEEVLLRTYLGEQTLPVEVDKTQFETAILNLVVNARDAMPRGGVVTIATDEVVLEEEGLRPGLRPGPYVAVRVADTGAGMPPAVLERVFEPFFTTKDVGKGTGLGLSMVYGFVQQSGGHARIESQVGHGTTVEILLPRSAAPPLAQQTRKAEPPPEQGHERVLLVEDQEDLRAFVSAQLTSLGYQVASVPDAETALSRLQAGADVELLFTDIIMPGPLDGIQLAEQAAILRPDLRVLFTTGYSDLAMERSSHILESGVPVLKKPYRRSELSGALRAALASSPLTLESCSRN